MKKTKDKSEIFVGFFILCCIYYLEGAFCEIFLNAINAVTSSQQVDHSAGASIGAFLGNLRIINEYFTAIQWILFVVTGFVWWFLVRKNKFIYLFLRKLSEKRVTWIIGYLCTYGIIFVSYDRFTSFYKNYGIEGVDLTPINKLIVFALTMMGTIVIYRFEDKRYEQYFQKRYMIIFVLLIGYIAFASCGEFLFLSDPYVVWSVSLQKLSVFVLFGFWLVPLILGFIDCLNLLLIREKHQNDQTKKATGIVLFIMILGYAGYFYIVYPGIITQDAIVVWTQIMNNQPLTREFPAFLKIIWKLCYMVYPNVAIVTLLQIVLWISLATTWISYFMKKGMKKKCAYMIAFITSFTTPFNLFVLMQESNFYYTVALLWVTYFLVQLINNEDYFKKNLISIIGLCISLVGIFVSRNEGKITYIFILIGLIIFCILKRNLRMASTVIASIVLVIVIQGPIFHIMKIPVFQEKSDNSVNLLVNDVTLGVLHFDGKLSEESIEILERYAKRQDIAEMYEEYYYDCGKDASIAGFVANDDEVYSVAKDSILHNIGVAFRERLNKSQSVWNIVAVPDAKQNHLSIGIVENDLGLIAKNGILNKIFTQLLYYPTFMICILDILIYRSGLSMCFLAILCFIWVIDGKQNRLLTALPVIAHFMVLLLSLLWPCSRHVWCIVLMVWILMINHIYTGDDNERISDCSSV